MPRDPQLPARHLTFHHLTSHHLTLALAAVLALSAAALAQTAPLNEAIIGPLRDGSQFQFGVEVKEWGADTPLDQAPTRTTVLDAHYLAYGHIPATGTFEVALRATERRPGDPPFVHSGDPDQAAPPGRDRVLFISLDERNRVDSVFGQWTFAPFDHLSLSPVPPADLGDAKAKTESELLHLAKESFIAELHWEVTVEGPVRTVSGSLTKPVDPADRQGPRLTKYAVRYLHDREKKTRRFQSSWTIESSGKRLLTVRVSSGDGTASDLNPDLHFQRRAELATVKGQMKLVHPGGDLDERARFAELLRERLFGSPWRKVTLDMFDAHVVAVRPLAVKYQAQLTKLEARYDDLLPDFAGKDASGRAWDRAACAGKPTVLVLMSSRDPVDNERFLTELEPLRLTYDERLRVIVLTREGAGTPIAPSPLEKFLKTEGVEYPLLSGQGSYFDELGIVQTPTVLLIDEQGILESSSVGYPPYFGGEKLKLNLQGLFQ